jgi:hypothetical protein
LGAYARPDRSTHRSAALRERIDQQYLAKNPHGYRYHSATGVPFPQDG